MRYTITIEATNGKCETAQHRWSADADTPETANEWAAAYRKIYVTPPMFPPAKIVSVVPYEMPSCDDWMAQEAMKG